MIVGLVVVVGVAHTESNSPAKGAAKKPPPLQFWPIRLLKVTKSGGLHWSKARKEGRVFMLPPVLEADEKERNNYLVHFGSENKERKDSLSCPSVL